MREDDPERYRQLCVMFRPWVLGADPAEELPYVPHLRNLNDRENWKRSWEVYSEPGGGIVSQHVCAVIQVYIQQQKIAPSTPEDGALCSRACAIGAGGVVTGVEVAKASRTLLFVAQSTSMCRKSTIACDDGQHIVRPGRIPVGDQTRPDRIPVSRSGRIPASGS